MTTSDFLDLKLARLSAFVGAGKGLRAAVYSALAHIRDFVLIESIDFNDARSPAPAREVANLACPARINRAGPLLLQSQRNETTQPACGQKWQSE